MPLARKSSGMTWLAVPSSETTVQDDEIGEGNLKESKSLSQLIGASLRNRYFWANFVYILYTVGMLFIDYGDFSDVDIYRMYYGFNACHFVNAWLYVWSWTNRRWSDPVIWPDYANVIAAVLYFLSSTLYPYEDGDYGRGTMRVHEIETLAAVLEVVAAVGWTYSWNASYIRLPGRGYTLDDPDVWAIITLYIGAVMYLVYNIQLLMDPTQYDTNDLYKQGDIWYFVNSLCYMAAALRDDGWWWWMPLAGGWPDEEGYLVLKRVFYRRLKQQEGGDEMVAAVDIINKAEAPLILDRAPTPTSSASTTIGAYTPRVVADTIPEVDSMAVTI